MPQIPPPPGDLDLYLLSEGTHSALWHCLGARYSPSATRFSVWAPSATSVSVIGDFNHWDASSTPMTRVGTSGVFTALVPSLPLGSLYKYSITSPSGHSEKADPLGFGAEHAPSTASVVRDLSSYSWNDQAWMSSRETRQRRDEPISIYEVHLGSWRRQSGNRPMSYLEAADQLVSYCTSMGFTHLQLLPISEHPFDGSWGYQPVGLYAPTIRYGTPDEIRTLVDRAHSAGLGVLLDWVPGHFPSDDHGLANFDGTPLYEYPDPREGFHQDWNTLIYNYARPEVASFLISNALFWLEEYHIDGLRVDAVASMLYRDYSRAWDAWIPNCDGGRENYEAIALLRAMNTKAYAAHPGIMTVAEESTSFPKVSAPVDQGGLGFGYKWNMGWMNDTLSYMQEDPINRKYHHHKMTFGIDYAFSENFVLPISHDEVVHGKGSMLEKMPGDWLEKLANLRAYYGFMWGHPGKKLLFMGQELAQGTEWNHDGSVDWDALLNPHHAGVQRLVRDLNTTYRATPALYARDCEAEGFSWIVGDDAQNSVFVWLRQAPGAAPVVVLCNMTPVERSDYQIGLPLSGHWREIFNSDAEIYGGGNRGNLGGVNSLDGPSHGQPFSARLTLPPLSTIFLKFDDN